MREAEKKNCLDCLYCKVSAKSAANDRLCFCAKGDREERRPERFWFGKEVCEKFEDMEE
jgi:hypothetical protein